MYSSTVTFSNNEQRQLMLKQISMRISELKESGETHEKWQYDIDQLTGFKHFFDVKGTFTIRMCDIVLIRKLLNNE